MRPFVLDDVIHHQPDEVLLVIATPGWITGQSYMLAAALLCCLSPLAGLGRLARCAAVLVVPGLAWFGLVGWFGAPAQGGISI